MPADIQINHRTVAGVTIFTLTGAPVTTGARSGCARS